MGGKGAAVPDGVGRGYIYDESGILRRCQLTFDGFELEQTCPRGVCLLKSREERVWSWHTRAVEGGRRDAVASRTAVEMEFQPAVTTLSMLTLASNSLIQKTSLVRMES